MAKSARLRQSSSAGNSREVNDVSASYRTNDWDSEAPAQSLFRETDSVWDFARLFAASLKLEVPKAYRTPINCRLLGEAERISAEKKRIAPHHSAREWSRVKG